MPLGPWITLRDDIDIAGVKLEFELNGTLMQSALASQMAFPIDELIAELSFGMTLHAGDVLLTGTPSGIGQWRATPPVFLKARRPARDTRLRAGRIAKHHARGRLERVSRRRHLRWTHCEFSTWPAMAWRFPT